MRTSLLPGILKTISSNKHLPLPIKLFECSDIVLRDESCERRARNQRNLCMVVADTTSRLEIVRGMVDRIFQILNVSQTHSRSETVAKEDSVTSVNVKNGFYIDEESSVETYFKGRRADVVYEGKVVGTFGVLHPDVLEKFEIGFPCTAFEMNIEPFL